jgi:YVTN family beta-propeller protein
MYRFLFFVVCAFTLFSCDENNVVVSIAENEESAEVTDYPGYFGDEGIFDPAEVGLKIGAALAQGEHVDLARGQTATQSSTGYGGIAGRAVDGNAGGSAYANGSVTATSEENQPWWQVDLGQPYRLSGIRIWNRADCCAERLANFYIFVADYDMRDSSLDALLADQAVWNHHRVPAVGLNGSISVDIPAAGRFVRIQKVDTGILSLAEVKVYGENLAEGKTATQSTTGYGGAPSRAVDGNTDGTYGNRSVTATTDQNEPWWQVDLGEQVSIGRIKLFNRRDCCSRRLSHFYVFVSERDMSGRTLAELVNDPQVWKSFEVAGVGATYLVSGRSSGRYIRVQRNTRGILSLAEVAAYGVPTRQLNEFKTNPAIYGEWSDVIEWPHISVHAGMLPSGKILTYDATPDDFHPVLDPVASPNDTTRASVWDYVTGIHQDAANNTGDDLFCSGHTLMPNGNYFAAGGTTGYNASIRSTNIFDYANESWRAGPTMQYARWYPTVTNLASGELIIAGGRGAYPEIYNPDTGALRTLTGDGLNTTNTAWPFLMQAPNGRVLYAGGARQQSLSFIDTEGAGTLTPTSSTVVDRNRGSFVAYDIGRMLVTGGVGGRKSASTIVMDTAQVEAASPMHLPRQDHNTLALPNGQVMVVGGNQLGGFCNDEAASYAPEIWDPSTGNWTLLGAQQHPRQYHSTAVLLPDGRVWSGGQGYATVVSTQVALCSYQNNAEIFSPPYLFNSDGSLADRPLISAAPERIEHGQSFQVTTDDAAAIGSISLIRLSTATHATNFSQRFLPLVFRRANGNLLEVDAPLNPNIAPAGYYMLFLLNERGTPSVSRIIKVGGEQVGGLSYNFDFGADGSPVEPGWMQVTPATNTSLFSWALSSPNVVDRGQANNGNRLDRDIVYGSRETQLNFEVGNGVWRVTMRMGDNGPYPHDRMSVSAEGAVVNGDINTAASQMIYIGNNTTSLNETSFDVQVTDGTLSINIADLGGRDANWVLSSIKVELLEDVDIAAPEIQPVSPVPAALGTGVPLSVQVTGIGQLQYSWNFGDGTAPTPFAANQSQVSHNFPAPGRYVVTASVRDASGVTSTHTFTQIVYATPTASMPVASTSIVEHVANDQVWNVNPDNNSVTIISNSTYELLATVNVGLNPVGLAISPDNSVWVTNKGDSTISVVNATTLTVQNTLALPTGSAPHGIVFDQSAGYLALEAAAKIVKMNPANGLVEEEISLDYRPRHLTLNGDRSRLFTSVFITPPFPGEHTLTPLVADQNGTYGGMVLALSTAPFAQLSVITLNYNDQLASDESGPGIPNYLGALAISPDGTFGWVPSKQDNILNGELRTSNSLRFDHAVRAISSRVDLSALTENVDNRIDHDNASIASQGVFDGLGAFLFTTLEGNRQVAVSDANTNRELFRFDVGRAPQGLAVSADNMRLYVHNFMDRTVGIYSIDELTSGRANTVTELGVVQTVASDNLSSQVLRGKQLFYDAKDDRLAAQDYMSCASCHNEGGHDGRVWDFSQAGEGLRNTTTLRGRGGVRHGFLHWSANFDEVQDFEAQIREFAGGAGLMSNADFATGTRSQPLGDSKAGISADLDALAAYVNSLTRPPVSPYSGADTDQGAILFAAKGCAGCHAGAHFTDSGSGDDVHDVGTIKGPSGQRLGGALTGIDTPGLLGVWATAPYLHDGSARTIEAAIEAHTTIDTTIDERNQLAQYVKGLSAVVEDVHLRGTASGSPAFAADGTVTIDSVDDRITVPHTAPVAIGDGDFSLSFWMRLEQTATGQWRSVMHKGATNLERTVGLWMEPNRNAMHFAISTTTNWNRVVSTTRELQLDEWTNIAYVRKGAQLLIYLDGELDRSISIPGQVVANTGDLMIGQSPWYQPALASYADVNVYHYALDKTEVKSISGSFLPTVSPALPTLEPVTDNKLLNGDFEQGKTGWIDCADSSLTTITTSVYEGSGALRLQNTGCIYQEFPITPDKSYQLRCYARSAGSLYTSMSMYLGDANYIALESAEVPVASGGFQPYESTLLAPVNSAIGVVTLYSDDDGTFDSCSVEEL